MPATTSAYGVTNPAGMDAWPIEQILAPLAAGGDPGAAQIQLNMYGAQREAANRQYASDLQQQHDFAYWNALQQLQVEHNKNLVDASKSPYFAQLLTTPGVGGMAGMSPDAYQSVADQQQREVNAKVIQALGTGMGNLSRGGYEMTPEVASSTLGIPVSSLGSDLVRAAQIRANASMAAAARGGGGSDPNAVHVSGPLPITGPDGVVTMGTASAKSPAALAAAQANARRLGSAIPPGGNASGQPPPTKPAEQTQTKDTSAPAAGPGVIPRAQLSDWTNAPSNERVQHATTLFNAMKNNMDERVRADIEADMQGGRVRVVRSPDGKREAVVGAKNGYLIPTGQ